MKVPYLTLLLSMNRLYGTLGFLVVGNRPSSVVQSGFQASASSSVVATKAPPSWEALSENLLSNESVAEEPVLTLYRDTNGWCPFCERVWVALRVKNIPYRESLIPLQDKPQWYKDLVPTTLVPAVLFHDNNNNKDDNNNKNERRIVWESMDILKALDEAFPDTPQLVADTPEFEEAMKEVNELFSAGISYQFSSRNDTLTEADVNALREGFLSKLDDLDTALATSGGPFRGGSDFTALDASMIPTMERWRYQLPITMGVDITEGRPNVQKWFDTLDHYSPYASRVAGDEYSWTAVASTFLRYFGGDEGNPKVAAAIERADAAAETLTRAFGNVVDLPGAEFAGEAARKLISNHEAVVNDCTRKEPKSQKHLPRASSAETADLVLRHVASVLVDGSDDPVTFAESTPLVELDGDSSRDGALAARTVASRLCVPRDMSAPAAKTLRAVLSITADRLEKGT